MDRIQLYLFYYVHCSRKAHQRANKPLQAKKCEKDRNAQKNVNLKSYDVFAMTITDTVSHRFASSLFGIDPQTEIFIGHPISSSTAKIPLNAIMASCPGHGETSGHYCMDPKVNKTFHQKHISSLCRKTRRYCIGMGWLLQHVGRWQGLHRRREERIVPERALHDVLSKQVSLEAGNLGRS